VRDNAQSRVAKSSSTPQVAGVGAVLRAGWCRNSSDVSFGDFGAAHTKLRYVGCSVTPVVPNIALRAHEYPVMADSSPSPAARDSLLPQIEGG